MIKLYWTAKLYVHPPSTRQIWSKCENHGVNVHFYGYLEGPGNQIVWFTKLDEYDHHDDEEKEEADDDWNSNQEHPITSYAI